MKHKKIGLVLALLALVPCFASASTISLHFSGLIYNAYDPYGFLTGKIVDGNSFDGILTYDNSLPDLGTSDPTQAIYQSLTQYSVSVNGYVFNDSKDNQQGYVQVWDDSVVAPPYIEDVVSFSPPIHQDLSPPISVGDGAVYISSTLMFIDYSHTALKNGKAIPANIDLANYGVAYFELFQMNMDTQQSFLLLGNVTSLVPVPVAAVPVPAAVWLFGSAWVGLMGLNRRKNIG